MSLTPRETDILCRTADGMPQKTIAHQLGISPTMVANYTNRIKDKIGAITLPHAVALAIRQGIIK